MAFVHGFLLGLSLIVAIGAQNAFVLRQGLRGEYVLAIVLTCAFSDAVLVTVGVAGFGAMAALMPWLDSVLRYGGATFLAVYGARSLWSAFGPDRRLVPFGSGGSLISALGTCLAFTWLNPHVYLDTVVLIGSLSTHYQGHAAGFAAGAMTASFVFFFALGYGARPLRPLLARPAAWRALEVVIALTMWRLAIRVLGVP